MGTVKDVTGTGLTAAKRALSSAPPNDAYLHWDALEVEKLVENEEERMKQVAGTMSRMQEHKFDRHRRAFTVTYIKTQGILKSTLTVPADLPANLKQTFSAQVAARYANEPAFL